MRSIRIVLLLGLCAVSLSFAQEERKPDDSDRSRWERAWTEASSSASFSPSSLAREIVQGELVAYAGEDAESHARRSFAAALRVESALRFGATGQETRARLRQSIKVQERVGAESAERMTARLAKTERENPQSGRIPAPAAGKNPKGKNGQ